MARLRVISLFAGIGGFDLGLERAGFETVAFVEREPFCQDILRARWPGVPVFDDVAGVGAATLPACEVLCGGFPCQDISVAGRGEGIRGARSGLWSEYARLIGELEPRWVIVENVSALLGRGLSVVLADLSALGYDAEWDCIPASALGAPHQRDRVWIVAYPSGERVRLESEREQLGQALRGDGVTVDAGAAGPSAGRDPDGRGDAGDAVRDTEGDGRRPGRARRSVAAGQGQLVAERSLPDVADAARDGAGGSAPAGAERERVGAGGQPGRAAGALPDAERAQLEGHGRDAGQPQVAEPRGGGSPAGVADAASGGREGRRGLQPGGSRAERRGRSGDCGAAGVADPEPQRLAGRDERPGSPAGERPQSEPQGAGVGGQRCGLAEPDLGRGADGLPAKMDGSIVGIAEWLDGSWERDISRVIVGRQPDRIPRLRALGNALVPQIAQWIGERIMQCEREGL